jgi:pyridoxal phosphate enzyme (YggS family)
VPRLEENLRAVRERIAAAARSAGRDPSSVALLAVSKTWPADDVRALAALGQRDFGENRAQELIAKAAQVAGAGSATVRWHFIGQLQRNKAAAVARLGAVVHSVDRAALAQVLDRVGQETGRPVEVLVQADLGGEPGGAASRGGAPPDHVTSLADAIAGCPGLRLRGVMAVAPRAADPGPAFERLAVLAGRLRADHPEAVEISAGMSGDMEAAIAAGATIVRVGTALFGARPLVSDQDRISTATRVTPVTSVPQAPAGP